MEASIIKIGNSRGLRLNKQILDQYRITDKVELILEEDQIILKPIEAPRRGWNDSFKKMAKEGGDELLLNDVLPNENFDEWN